MQSRATTVKDYLESLPKERRKTVSTLRTLIRKNLPRGYREVMAGGMVGYVVPLERYPDTYNGQPLCIAGLASQKDYVSLYLMGVYANPVIESWFKAEYAKSGKKLNMGKSCLRFKALADIPLDLIGRTIARVPVVEFIGYYESVKGRSAPSGEVEVRRPPRLTRAGEDRREPGSGFDGASGPRYNLSMAKLKLGVVGCGVIGPHHMKGSAASSTIDLVAVADLIEDRARAKATEYKVPKVFRDGAELIRDPEVQAVVLAFPAGKRAELAYQALRQGKHVLLEKPGATKAAEIEKMIKLQGKLVGACCSSRYKFLPSFEAARDFVATGALGEIREIYGRNIFSAGPVSKDPPPSWRASTAQNGGGILVNWSPYDLDYLLSVAGWSVEPETVFAQTWPVAPHLAARVDPASDAENHYVALIRCRGGSVIHVERGEFSSLQDETVWQIIGSRASLRLHMTLQETKRIWLDETDAQKGVTSRVLWEGREDSTRVYDGPVQDFAAAVLENRAPRTDLQMTLRIQRIFDGIYASAASGKAVHV